ncbi:hypothetical protein GCM10009097_22810 [Pigmentiphaga daeguensis]|uniref:NAD-dependent epimerase/dehydratase domain-containing protein n=2 Tax=Alcaligenaceae TaxID=506 RepID=A0ABN1BTU9_9BURK
MTKESGRKPCVLVLGAAGYIGRHLVRALAASGRAAPIAAVRRQAGLPAGMPIRYLDATDASALARALEGVDVVVNCIAGTPEVIVRGAEALRDVLAASVHRPRLIHFSSMAAYGTATGLIDESHPLLGDASAYSHAKAVSESMLAGVSDLVVLRPGCVYGRGSPQWTQDIGQLLRSGRLGDLGALGGHGSNLVHIDDVTDAVSRLLQEPAHCGPFNLAMSLAPSWNEYFHAYAEMLGVAPLRRVGQVRLALDAWGAGAALKMASIAARRLPIVAKVDMPPRLPPSLIRLWRQDIRLDSTRAERELGVSWTALDQGLRT